MKKEKMLRAVFYARVASERAITAENVNQIEHCTEYIKANGYALTGSYRDTGSGLRTSNDALNDLRADAAAGKFDVVVVFDVSRISRNAHAVREFMNEMQMHGVAVESVKEMIRL